MTSSSPTFPPLFKSLSDKFRFTKREKSPPRAKTPPREKISHHKTRIESNSEKSPTSLLVKKLTTSSGTPREPTENRNRSNSVTERLLLSPSPKSRKSPKNKKKNKLETLENPSILELVGPKDFIRIRLLGKGGFGQVFLVKHSQTGKHYAMKVLVKKTLKERSKIHRALTEKEILQKTNSPYIVSLHYFFQTQSKLFFVIEFCEGGEFFRNLKKQPQKCLTEEKCKFYAAEVLLALEYLHGSGCIYRDLKPENILLSSDGHIKLSDFDLAKSSSVVLYQTRGINKEIIDVLECEIQTKSFVGTAEYMAPEIITGPEHNSCVDWWSLGILIFEMLFGRTPFVAGDHETTYNNIQKAVIKFPKKPVISKECKLLIKKLLVVDPSKRLGALGGAFDIKSHPFFKSIKWDNLIQEEPPIIPKPFDPSNLDQDIFPSWKDDYNSDEEEEQQSNEEAWKKFTSYTKNDEGNH